MIIYRLFSSLLLPIWFIWMGYRLWKGKEDWSRIGERFGLATKNTSLVLSNDNAFIWIHAASVGESLVAVTLVKKLSVLYPRYSFLITTGTVTSANMIASRLPPRAFHQFVPIDEYFCIKRFLNRWKPTLALMVESEIWPNLISLTTRYCPVMLVSATISDKSFAKWRKWPLFAKNLLQNFTHILCQNEVIAEKYKALGVVAETKGNIKYSSSKPMWEATKLETLRKQIGERSSVMLAVSTHPGDEEIICRLHIALKKLHPNLLTIIAPRHSYRSREVVGIITQYNLSFGVRSKGENPGDIYLADTLGELALFFNVATVTIIGGSFKNGGHNIIEPAFFDTTIIFGPDMKNSEDIAKRFVDAKAAIQITNERALLEATQTALTTDMSHMHHNAKTILTAQNKVISGYIEIISRYIE